MKKSDKELLRILIEDAEGHRNHMAEASNMYEGYRELAKSISEEIFQIRSDLVFARAQRDAWKSRALTAEAQIKKQEEKPAGGEETKP